MIKNRFTVLILFLLIFDIQSNSQLNQYSGIVHHAIKDELARCLDSIKRDDCKPFFMDFGLSDTRAVNVLSTLGGIVFSADNSNIDFSTRLMIGSYHFNDENFDGSDSDHDIDDLAIPQTMLPENPEYWPIRMALWGSAERVVQSACKGYQEKLAALQQNGKTVDEYPLDDFSKSPVIVKIDSSLDDSFISKEKCEFIAKKLSVQFKNYPDIINSIVYVNSAAANYYFHNSEGTKIQFPVQAIKIYISAVARKEGASSAASSINFIGLTDKDLPDLNSMISSVRNFADKLVQAVDFPAVEEEYTGPVLYEDLAASELFQQALFQSRTLVAKREQMADSRSSFHLPDKPSANSIERKLDKLIIDNSLTVLSMPYLTEYDGLRLIGSFNMDAEGVQPPDTLVLIKDGKLQSLFNDRVPTFSFHSSNGHKRVYLTRNGTRSIMGPGVVQIKTSAGLSRSLLKKKLIERAIEEDLDYAYIFRKDNNDHPFYYLYRVDVKTGEEQPVRYFSIPGVDLDDLKDDALFSDSEMVGNFILGRNGFLSHQEGIRPGMSEGEGLPVSIVSPAAVLIDKQKLIAKTERENYKTPVVPSPLQE